MNKWPERPVQSVEDHCGFVRTENDDVIACTNRGAFHMIDALTGNHVCLVCRTHAIQWLDDPGYTLYAVTDDDYQWRLIQEGKR